MLMFWIHLAIVLTCIFIGARLGGLGLGLLGGLGLAVLVFVFKLPMGTLPIDVIFIILAVITAASCLQAAGGLDYLVLLAEKALRKNPKMITFVAPMVTWLFTFGAGTGHVAYSVMPVIAEVSREAGVRPERPMSVATIASQQAITCSPVSAATASMLIIFTSGVYADSGISLAAILAICAPATFLGCMVAAFVMNFIGKDLKDDEIYRERVAKGEIPPIPTTSVERNIKPGARLSVLLFLIGAFGVVVMGLISGAKKGTFEFLMPLKKFLFERMVDGELTAINMPQTIEITMLVIAALIVILCKVKVDEIVTGNVFKAGIIAVIAIFGIAWMGNTFFEAHRGVIQGGLSAVVASSPSLAALLLALALFVLSILLYSQGATVNALMPLAASLGPLNPFFCLAIFPSVNGYFFIPNYPTVVAAINFDRTGTTKIGKYVLNHSFMLPGLIATASAITIGFGIASVFF